MTRTFVLLGQGGRITSPGMVSLAARLPNASVHSWDDSEVLPEINACKGKIAVVGYSLGANQIGWLGRYATPKIDIGVAYDPSRLSPMVKLVGGLSGAKYAQTAPNFKKLICFRNVGAWLFGGSTYIGSNVEEYTVNNFHLGIQFNEELHLKTIKAIKAI